MAKMRVTDQTGQFHEVEGLPGLKIMETLREYDYGVTRSVAPVPLRHLPHPRRPRMAVPIAAPAEAMRRTCSSSCSITMPALPGCSCQVEFTEALDGCR